MDQKAGEAIVEPRGASRLRAVLPDLCALLASQRRALPLGLLLIVISRTAALAPPLATKFLVDDVLGKRDVDRLLPLTFFLVVAALVQASAGYALAHVRTMWAVRTVSELRKRLHAHMMRLPLAYHDGAKSGTSANRIMSEVLGINSFLATGLPQLTSGVATAALAFLIMARLSLPLAGVVLVGVTLFGALSALPTRHAKAIAARRAEIIADIFGRLTEAFGGARVIKAYRGEAREDAIFAEGMARLVDNTAKSVAISSRSALLSNSIWGLSGAIVVYAGARLILSGELTLGALFTFTLLLRFMVTPVLQISDFGMSLMDAVAGLERVRALLAQAPEQADPRRVRDIGAIRGEVTFDHVDFAFAPGQPVLQDVCFGAAPGTMTALVGPSGAGKSTVLGLIASFQKATAGAVRVDGADLADVRLDSYREQLGVVLQETFLFAGSILENIAFARPGATREEVIRAARTARVDEFVARMPHGYETRIGERGVRLSGGQRQRISMARAFLANPRILILDEPTSSQDANSEALIQTALSHLLIGRTTFIISHRLSTVRRADQILVLDGGRIVERGTHAALLALGGLYTEMHENQHRGAIDLFLAPGEGEPARRGPADPRRKAAELAAGEEGLEEGPRASARTW